MQLIRMAAEVGPSMSGGDGPCEAHHQCKGTPQEVLKGWAEEAPKVLAGQWWVTIGYANIKGALSSSSTSDILHA